MASEVDIANRALSMLGERRIIALTDDNKAGRAMNARYALLRDALIAEYPWRFAVKRVQLAALTEVPVWGYSVMYERPGDDLRTIKIGGPAINAGAIGVIYESSGYSMLAEAPYEIIEGKIHTNLSAPLDYEYLARITVSGNFDPLFAEALACRIALDAAEELTQSRSKKDDAARFFKRAIDTAKRNNSLMRPPRRRVTGQWMNSRVASRG
jgi:hypothetical protein